MVPSSTSVLHPVEVSSFGMLRSASALLIASDGTCGSSPVSSLGSVQSLAAVDNTLLRVQVQRQYSGGFVKLCVGFTGLAGPPQETVQDPEILLEGIQVLTALPWQAEQNGQIILLEENAPSRWCRLSFSFSNPPFPLPLP